MTPATEETPRARLEAAIEAGIVLLDLMDGDTDLEDGHDAEADESDLEPDDWTEGPLPPFVLDQRLLVEGKG